MSQYCGWPNCQNQNGDQSRHPSPHVPVLRFTASIQVNVRPACRREIGQPRYRNELIIASLEMLMNRRYLQIMGEDCLFHINIFIK
jgi:hypothetical protein